MGSLSMETGQATHWWGATGGSVISLAFVGKRPHCFMNGRMTHPPSFILSQQVTAVVVAAIKKQYRLGHTSTFSQLNYLYFYFRSTYTHFPRILKFLHSLHKHIRIMYNIYIYNNNKKFLLRVFHLTTRKMTHIWSMIQNTNSRPLFTWSIDGPPWRKTFWAPRYVRDSWIPP